MEITMLPATTMATTKDLVTEVDTAMVDTEMVDTEMVDTEVEHGDTTDKDEVDTVVTPDAATNPNTKRQQTRYDTSAAKRLKC